MTLYCSTVLFIASFSFQCVPLQNRLIPRRKNLFFFLCCAAIVVRLFIIMLSLLYINGSGFTGFYTNDNHRNDYWSSLLFSSEGWHRNIKTFVLSCRNSAKASSISVDVDVLFLIEASRSNSTPFGETSLVSINFAMFSLATYPVLSCFWC